jgi:hypothetical protein
MIVGTITVAKPNSKWRIHEYGMEKCCIRTLEIAMYDREDKGQELMIEGDTIKCLNCNSEMICDPSLRDGRLRWRWNGNR